MPAILPMDLEQGLLDTEITKERALSLLQPRRLLLMNSARNDDPSLLIPDSLAA